MTATRGRGGFTLLELVSALALVAVLSGALFAALQIGVQTRRRAGAALAPLHEAVTAFGVLGRDLAAAAPPRGILAGPFSGDGTEVVFYTRPMWTPETAPGIVRVAYGPREDELSGRMVLVRALTVNLLALEEPEPLEEELCADLLELSLAYHDGTSWLETWDSLTMGDTLPRAVELSVLVAAPGNDEVGGGGGTRRLRRVFVLPAAEPLPFETAEENDDLFF